MRNIRNENPNHKNEEVAYGELAGPGRLTTSNEFGLGVERNEVDGADFALLVELAADDDWSARELVGGELKGSVHIEHPLLGEETSRLETKNDSKDTT